MNPQTGVTKETAGAEPAAVLPSLESLTKRADFLAAAKGLRKGTTGFHLQARDRGTGGPIRFGITCSRKVGNAVARNRAKRRLREVARAELPLHGCAGWDYVLIGRREITAAHPFTEMRADLVRALQELHR